MNKNGTPKTIIQAILNSGIEPTYGDIYFDPKTTEHHILDFLRQKFARLYLEIKDPESLKSVRLVAIELGIERPKEEAIRLRAPECESCGRSSRDLDESCLCVECRSSRFDPY
jgi:hypothetical protein